MRLQRMAVTAAAVAIVISTSVTGPATGVATANSAPGSAVAARAAATHTLFFIKTQADGSAYAVGAKVTGRKVRGWAAPLRSDAIGCFQGKVSSGRLRGTIAYPPMPSGPAPRQRISWPASGKGPAFRLAATDQVSGLVKTTRATVNRYAGFPAGHSWASLFNFCADY